MINRVEATILDKSYTLTPGFRVMESWEDRINVHDMAKDLMNGKVKYKDLTWVIYASLRFGKDDSDPSPVGYYDLGDWVVSNLSDAVKVAHDLIAAALLAGSEDARPKKSHPSQEKT